MSLFQLAGKLKPNEFTNQELAGYLARKLADIQNYVTPNCSS
jgi:hypothetical protein